MSRTAPPGAAGPRKILYLRVARQLQDNRSMPRLRQLLPRRLLAPLERLAPLARLAPVAVLAALGGCFYLEEINHRPAIEIVRRTDVAVERGTSVELEAEIYDPDDQPVTIAWRAYACAQTTQECDEVPFFESSARTVSVPAPLRTEAGQAVQHLRVSLTAVDARGARALPEQVLAVDVVNAAPRLVGPQPVAARATRGLPLELRVQRSDSDDRVEDVRLTWKVFGPVGTAHPPLRQLASDDPAIDRQELVPDVAGAWTVEVTAVDPAGGTATAQRAFVVSDEAPPCINALSPPASLPLLFDQPRRLAVLSVDDDFDPFPASASGAARFSWSLATPSRGGARQPLVGTTGSFVDLDPAGFVPGEVVELRVEVADRVARALPCGDGEATCSIQRNSCVQRQTWRLEVR